MTRTSLALKIKNAFAGKRRAGKTEFADEILARAEAIVERLSDEYPGYASRDIEVLVTLSEQLALGGPSGDRIVEISRIAHDMRGQGTVFGYPLMTRFAGSLCKATRVIGSCDDSTLSVINTHIEALRAVLRGQITNGNDKTGLAVAAGLEILVASRATR
ncbi:MAG: hypothetical protein V3S44_06630 [Alphaproteobacteria bacterium]